jgi:hypothetical protein
MQKLILPKLNHKAENWEDSLGLSFYQRNFVSNAILFEALSARMLVKDLYDSPDEAPDELTTATGTLDLAFSHLRTPEEQTYCLLIFRDVRSEVLGLYEELEAMENKKSEKKPEGDKKEEDAQDKFVRGLRMVIEDMFTKTRYAPIQMAIRAIKDSNFTWDKFIEKVCPKDKMDQIDSEIQGMKKSGVKGNLNELLGKLFGKDPDMGDQ